MPLVWYFYYMEIYEELGFIQVEPTIITEENNMSNYNEEIIDGQLQLYNALIKKCIDGGTLTDNEFMFIVRLEKKIDKSMRKSPIEQLLDGAKGFIGLMRDTFAEEEYEDIKENDEDGI